MTPESVPSAPEIDLIVSAIRESRRYRHVDESVVRRCAAEALEASRGRRADAIKRTKRQLHQVHGAYVGVAPRYDRLLTRLRDARNDGPDALQRELRSVMTLHASTRERVHTVDRFYAGLFDRIGEVRSVLDVGCGLNPLAAPWMRLAPGAVYTAIDIDASLMAFVGSCLELLDIEQQALVMDVVASAPAIDADLALVLKMVPCLEQQRDGAGADLLRSLRARTIAVSFPIRSLGGRDKGMRASYARAFEETIARERWTAEEIDVPGELLYVIAK